ncbi:hypothetical protein MMC06_000874 [Schaereria dolodes]|nr:hypothetical protein [Schaereria dolodes]
MEKPKRPQPDTPEVKFTPEDVISWYLEELVDSGRIKFSTAWHPERITDLMAFGPDDSTSVEAMSSTDELDLHRATRDLNKVMNRAEHVHKLIRTNRCLSNDTMRLVEERLLAAGMSEATLERLPKGQAGLARKVAALYGLQHPEPNEPTTVEVNLIVAASEDGEETRNKRLYLPADGSLADIEAVLQDHSTIMVKGYPVNFGQGPWLYQLADKLSRALDGTTRETLVTDTDYKRMVWKVMGKHSETPIVSLFQVCSSSKKWSFPSLTVDQQSTLLAYQKLKGNPKEDEDRDDDELDEEGKPFFESLDWNRIIEKDQCLTELMSRRRSARLIASASKKT